MEKEKSDNVQDKNASELRRFFKAVWDEFEPIVIDFFLYLLTILLIYLLTWVTDSFIPEKIKDVLNYIKYGLIISVIGLFTIRTVLSILIRTIGSLAKEGKKTFSNDSKVSEELKEIKDEVVKLEEQEEAFFKKSLADATFDDMGRSNKEKTPVKK